MSKEKFVPEYSVALFNCKKQEPDFLHKGLAKL